MLVIDGDITWWEILILLLLLVAGDTRVVDWVCIGIVLLVVLWFIGWFVDEVLGLLLFVWIDVGSRSDDNYDEVIFVGNIYKLHYLHKVRTLSRICWIIVVFHCYDIFYIVYDYNKGKIIVNKHK